MKKISLLLTVLIILINVIFVSGQDLQATNQALELQLTILKLQATKQALEAQMGQQSQPTPAPVSTMMTWGSQNSPFFPTPTPVYGYSGPVNQQNFPAYVQPPVPNGPPPVWDKPKTNRLTEIFVGNHGTYPTIAEALKNIPDNPGEVVLYLTSDTEEPADGFGIPFNKGITVLRIASNTGEHRTVRPAGRSIWLFCNGVPLIIETEVEIAEKSMIMGGVNTYAGHNVRSPQSVIIINGSAWWVYAGGQSDRDGHSSTVDNALVIINGKVNRVFAGGRTIYGETIVNHATVILNGNANEVYCGGYNEYPNSKATVGKASMLIYGWYGAYGLSHGQGETLLLDPNGCY